MKMAVPIQFFLKLPILLHINTFSQIFSGLEINRCIAVWTAVNARKRDAVYLRTGALTSFMGRHSLSTCILGKTAFT